MDKDCSTASPKTKEFLELVREAMPLYVELLSTNPFYQARKYDKDFWISYIGSRPVAARDLVALSKGLSTAVDNPEPETQPQ